MATNSSSTKYAECNGSESDKSAKKKPLKQAALKTFFKIIPKIGSDGGPRITKVQSFTQTTINKIWSPLQEIDSKERMWNVELL